MVNDCAVNNMFSTSLPLELSVWFDNQCLTKKMQKNCLDIWWVQTKAVILQPFSRLAQASATRCHEDGNADKHWKSASYKENAEKMTEDLVSPNKSSNFAAAFEQTRPLGVESKKAPQSDLWNIEAIDVVQESMLYIIYKVYAQGNTMQFHYALRIGNCAL